MTDTHPPDASPDGPPIAAAPDAAAGDRERAHSHRRRWLPRELAVVALLIAISRNPELVISLSLLAFPELRRTWMRPLGQLMAKA